MSDSTTRGGVARLTHDIGGEVDDGQHDEGGHLGRWIALLERVPVPIVNNASATNMESGAEIPTETPWMAPEKHHEEYDNESGHRPHGCDPQGHTQPLLDVRKNLEVELDKRGLYQPQR